jgi:putative ABC transport system permease protein
VNGYFRALLRIWLRPFRTLGSFAGLWLLTLALGISVGTVTFTQLRQTILQPYAAPHPEQLIVINREQGMCQNCPVSAGLWRDVAAIPGLDASGFTGMSMRLSAPDVGAQKVDVTVTTPHFFGMIGAAPRLGRNLLDSDADGEAVVISAAFWRRSFASDPAVIGKNVRLGASSAQIVGVLEDSFARIARSDLFQASRFSTQGDGTNFISLIARQAPTLSDAALAAGLSGALANSRTRSPENFSAADYRLIPMPLQRARTKWLRSTLTPVLLIVSLLAFLMACNAASLFAVSVLDRLRALTTEIALGAPRTLLLRQVVQQSLLFTVSAGLLALLITPVIFELSRRYLLLEMQSLAEVRFDWVTWLGVTVGFALLNTLAAWLPARLVLRDAALNQSERTQVSGVGQRTARIALAVQLTGATAVVLLALLLVRTLGQLSDVDPGFDVTPLWSAKLILPNDTDSTDPSQVERAVAGNMAFVDRLISSVRTIPGVAEVAVANDVPLGEQSWSNGDLVIPGAISKQANQLPYAQFRAVTQNYDSTLGIAMQSGRLPRYTPGSALSEIAVNQEYVTRFMDGIDPVGRVLEDRKLKVVGVLKNVNQVSLTAAVEPDVYAPLSVFTWINQLQVIVRGDARQSAADREALFALVRAKVAEIDPAVPVFEPQTGEQLRASSMIDTTLMTRILGAFAGLSLLTTALGLFGLCAFAVTRRRREFGLRLAIGAKPRELLQEVLQGNLNLSLKCAAVGLLLGCGFSKLIAQWLFGVRLFDLPSMFLALLAMLLLSVLATVLPAWAASRTSPLIALRGD